MSYVFRRVGQAVIVLLAAFTGAFILLQALPGDAIMIKFENPELGLSADQIQNIRLSYGIDTPLVIQYVHTLAGFITGDFGYSINSGTAVRSLLAEVLPQTARLAVLGFLAAALLAVGIAFASTFSRFGWLRKFLRNLPSLFISVPVFWLGIMLIQIFSFKLGLIPAVGAGPAQALILPVATLAVPIAAPLAQVLTRSIDEINAQPFIAVVQAKGAPPGWILWRNVAKNAVLPTLTIAGVLFGELIAGAVVTETVFGRAGIGRLTEQAVASQDTPVLQAIVILSASVFVLVNLTVDLLYPLLDPRLKTKVGAAT
ncbi:ABC transporter permease [Saxibacter everestensis]|uniref:ABC transporter permease n=1 Tax=Saxibacter everestensis TaxID=2909229 RepID=A0ABY8QTV8_9MICO|nr:ABC transporter permease [Brevibacteriaceae bacterium ZFBP1038]